MIYHHNTSHFENNIHVAERRHPVDYFEPLPAEEYNRSDISRMLVSIADTADSLPRIGTRLLVSLRQLRPDLVTLAQTNLAIVVSGYPVHEVQCFVETIQDDMFGLTEACAHESNSEAIDHPLIWAAQGKLPCDMGLRVLIMLRTLKVGIWGGASLAALAKLKGCRKQRVKSLSDKFEALWRNCHGR